MEEFPLFDFRSQRQVKSTYGEERRNTIVSSIRSCSLRISFHLQSKWSLWLEIPISGKLLWTYGAICFERKGLTAGGLRKESFLDALGLYLQGYRTSKNIDFTVDRASGRQYTSFEGNRKESEPRAPPKPLTPPPVSCLIAYFYPLWDERAMSSNQACLCCFFQWACPNNVLCGSFLSHLNTERHMVWWLAFHI